MSRLLLTCLAALPVFALAQDNPDAKPLRLAIAGLNPRARFRFFPGAPAAQGCAIVGVFDPDAALTAPTPSRDHLAPGDSRSPILAKMLDRSSPRPSPPSPITAGPRRVVEACARRHITVMMEKPLAVDMKQARAIQDAAAKSGIQRDGELRDHLVQQPWRNLEDLMQEQKAAGDIRRMVAMDGHQGPKEINVQPEFLAWLTDPVKNGAGALFDFGCYGANLMTWLMDNQRPLAVTAITQTDKPAHLPASG